MNKQYDMVLRRGKRNIEKGMKIYDEQLSVLRTELHTCKRMAAKRGMQLAEKVNLLKKQQEDANRCRSDVARLSVQLSKIRNLLKEQEKQTLEKQNLLEEQQKQTLEYANRLEEKDKMCEERACNVSILLKELNKCKAGLQFWRSKAMCCSCNQMVTPVVPPGQVLDNQDVKLENTIIIRYPPQIQ